MGERSNGVHVIDQHGNNHATTHRKPPLLPPPCRSFRTARDRPSRPRHRSFDVFHLPLDDALAWLAALALGARDAADVLAAYFAATHHTAADVVRNNTPPRAPPPDARDAANGGAADDVGGAANDDDDDDAYGAFARGACERLGGLFDAMRAPWREWARAAGCTCEERGAREVAFRVESTHVQKAKATVASTHRHREEPFCKEGERASPQPPPRGTAYFARA